MSQPVQEPLFPASEALEPGKTFMCAEDFAAKIEWEGGIYAALDYGLKSSDLDPDDESVKDLREAWRALEDIHQAGLRDAVAHLEGILEAIEEDDLDREVVDKVSKAFES